MTTHDAPLGTEAGIGETQGRTQPRARTVTSWILGILVGAVLSVILVGAVVWLSTGVGLLQLLGLLRGGRTHKIISGEHANAYLPQFLAGDRLLLVVHGEVVGGINLAGLQPGDVLVQGQKVSIHLPAAEIFSTRIDNAKTKVYSRDTGLFSSADPNLESEVREEAERQLQQAALQDGILKTAGDNARSTITGMLQGFGFHEVELR
jgi:hypothetical protein